MASQPSQGLGTETLHCQLWHEVVIIEVVVPDPTIGEDHVGVEDLACLGVNPARSNRGPDVIVEPANKIVADVLRPFSMWAATLGVLVLDHHRVDDADFLERLIPVINTCFDPTAVADWGRVFDVKANRLLRWTEL